MNEKEIVELFKKNNFRATPQRIAVYKYLIENPIHPDADEIYKNLVELNPSFSKTTVYNSVQALENQGLISKISIDTERVRYDATTDFHSHFMCSKCGKIKDFKVRIEDSLDLRGYKIISRNVYYNGICPECK